MSYIRMILLGALLLIGLPAMAEDNESIAVSLGSYTLNIPKRHFPDHSMTDFFSEFLGLDQSAQELLLSFDEQEIRKEVAGFISETNAKRVSVRIAALKPDEVALYRSSMEGKDIWYGRGDYENSIVERYDNLDLFRVYRHIEYPYSWAVVLREPSLETPPADGDKYVLARCVLSAGKVESGPASRCRTHVLWNELIIEFSISEINLGVLAGVGDFFLKQVTEWAER